MNKDRQQTSPSRLIVAALFALPIAAFLLSLHLGRYYIAPDTVIQIVASAILPIGRNWPDAAETVIFDIRLPRAALALSVGASLAVSGAAFQGMFRNPLVSSQILGVAAGSGFGAALAILVSGDPVLIQLSAFLFGVTAVAMAYAIGRVHRSSPVLMLVLSGVIVTAFFSALISLITYVADPYSKLPTIVFWLMGSLSRASNEDVLMAIPLMIIGIVGLLLVRWRLNILSMGDDEARALGVNTEHLKVLVVVCATLVSASAVSVSGMVGWVGLVIPHVGRMIVGPDHRILMPASLALGATYLLLVDSIARTVTSGEIPLGILTATLGAPFFAYLLRRTGGAWG